MYRKKQFANKITASKNYFVPLIQYCRNNCLYCGFSRQVVQNDGSPNLSTTMLVTKEEYVKHLDVAKAAGCRELLIVLGDRPEEISRVTREYLLETGFKNSIEYVYWACEMAIHSGLEPHINIGVIDKKEWNFLKPVISSAGLMLENSSDRLSIKGNTHQSSPDKIPKVRIQSIKAALEEEIPFTSGLLVGIGETDSERLETLYQLQEIALEFNFLQEIIVQGFHPLPNSPWRNKSPIPAHLILDTIAASRVIISPKVSIQSNMDEKL